MIDRSLIARIASEIRDIDEVSVLSRSELREVTCDRLHSMHPGKWQRLTNAYDAGEISRREFVKLIGVAGIGGVVALTAKGLFVDEHAIQQVTGRASAGGASYETVKVPANKTRGITVGDGETYENVLIDITASGASVLIATHGSGWTIRNVGIKGKHPGGGGHHLFQPSVADPDAEGLVENVYMGDGQPLDAARKGGVWVNANMPHRGTIIFRNYHLAKFVNGLYGSGVGHQGHEGDIRVENSYFYNNTIANVRTNAKERVNYVENTTIHVDGNQPVCKDCSQPNTQNTRAVWSWYGRTHLINCDVRGDLATSKGGSITQENTRVGDAADIAAPEGVPMSAEEAASGQGSGGVPSQSSSSDFPC